MRAVVSAVAWLVFAAALCMPIPAQAAGVVGNGTPASCTETAFAAALVGGGNVTFNCGGPTLIVLTAPKSIAANTTVDGANQITLSGGNATQLFSVGAGTSLTLRKLTLTNGFSSGDGGAIFNNGTLTLDESTIQNSNATNSGGAIISYGPLTITNSTLLNNKATNAGAIFPRFAAAVTRIINSHLRQNNAQGQGWGGAILPWDGANVTIEGGDIISNTARFGGGIYNVFADSAITLTGVLVQGNQGYVYGGGVYNENSMATISRTTFMANATENGGGIYTKNGKITITDSTFVKHSVEEGGGLYSASGTVTVLNTTFSENTALEGGAIRNLGTLTINDTTFFNNVATLPSYGGSIQQDSTTPVTLKNVAFKHGTSGKNCSASNSIEHPFSSGGFNLSDDFSCYSYVNQIGDQNNVDPKLGPLQDNGGLTQTHLPQAGSPLIDGGQCVSSIPTDQRGITRPQGPACDIGAVEVAVAPPVQKVYVPLTKR